jgi:hypothetical protein
MSEVKPILTAAGQELTAKIELGNGTLPLKITRIAAGSGTSPDPVNLTALVNEKQELSAISKSTDGALTRITCLLTNLGNPGTAPPTPPLAVSYQMSQIGFYASDPDKGEILYRILQLDIPVLIPAAAERGYTAKIDFNITTGNASEVTVNIDPAGLATIKYVDESKIDKSLIPAVQFLLDADGDGVPEVQTNPVKMRADSDGTAHIDPNGDYFLDRNPFENGFIKIRPVSELPQVQNDNVSAFFAKMFEIIQWYNSTPR